MSFIDYGPEGGSSTDVFHKGYFNPLVDGGGTGVPFTVVDGTTDYVSGDYVVAIEAGFYDFPNGLNDGTFTLTEVKVGDKVVYDGTKWVVISDPIDKFIGWMDPTVNGGDLPSPIIKSSTAFDTDQYVIIKNDGRYDLTTGLTAISPTGVEYKKGDRLRYDSASGLWDLYDESNTDIEHPYYMFSTTLAGDPTTGHLSLNNANYTLADVMRLSDFNMIGTDNTVHLERLSAGDSIIFTNADGSKNCIYTIGTPLVDNATYFDVPVTYVSHVGAFIQDEILILTVESSGEDPHGYIAETALATYTPDVTGLDFFHYDIDQPSLIDNIVNKELGDRGSIVVKFAVDGQAVTWGSEYWFPGGDPILEDGTDAWNIFDYRVIATDKICMEYVASCPGTTTVIPFIASFETNAATEIGFLDVDGTGSGIEWTNDGGTTWNNYSGASPWIVPAAGLYTLKKEDGPLNVMFGDISSAEGPKFINTMTVESHGATSLRYMFWTVASDIIDVSNVTTESVTSMWSTFNGCKGITTLDLSNWDTTACTDMQFMFYQCEILDDINIAGNVGWNTSNVTTMKSMFSGCLTLTGLNGSEFETNSLLIVSGMFSNCRNLTSLDLSSYDVSSITDLSNLVLGCDSLTSFITTGWNTSNVTNMTGLFRGTLAITTIDVSHWDVSSVSTFSSTFQDTPLLVNMDLSSWRLTSAKVLSSMFTNCGLTVIDTSNWGVTTATHLFMTFFNTQVSNLDFTSWNFDSGPNFGNMFADSTNLICITNMKTDQPSHPSKSNMFNNTTSLVEPDATAITDLISYDGADWVHPSTCP